MTSYPLGRAKETAQIIADTIKEETSQQIEIIEDSQAREFDFGEAEGKRESELTSEQKSQVDEIQKGWNATARVNGGESFTDLLLRRYQALEELSRQERYRGMTVVLVGHGMQLNADRILLGYENLLDHLRRIHYRGEGYTLPNAAPTLLSAPAGFSTRKA